MPGADRRTRLATALAAVHERIGRACAAAGRDPAAVTLVAVTKTYPASDVALLAGLGVRHVGENKDQEGAPKAAEAAAAGADVTWHFVGRLQRNKAASVVRWAGVVESADSLRLVRALDTAAARHRETPLDVLVQVSLDGDPERGGAVPDAAEPDRDLWRVADAVAAAGSLRLRGLMAVAPARADPDAAFAALAGLAARLRTAHPGATRLSAGMSGDLEQAVAHGATHVRIGSFLLGTRNTLR